jgi:Ca2+-binding RTX toxin-like protein
MKTRTILGLLVVVALFTLSGSAALADGPLTVEVIPGGWCSPTLAGGTIKLWVDNYSDLDNLSWTVTSDNWLVVPPAGLSVSWDFFLSRYNLNVNATPGPLAANVTVTFFDSETNQSATVDVMVRVGNEGVNTLPGSADEDLLIGLGGWDTLLGKGGNDLLCGGFGDDALSGGDGDDTLWGGPDTDHFNCGPGSNDFANAVGGEVVIGCEF